MRQVEKKQVCKCENCGNEAEMVVTCTLPDEEDHPVQPSGGAPLKAPGTQKVKGTAICIHCGNEADMWVDL